MKLSPKLKDLGIFTIPCIGPLSIKKGICDLRAKVDLMLLTIYKKLNVQRIKPTNIILHLKDQFIRHPHGILEGVLVKVGMLVLVANFMVRDMDDEGDIPLILGRPFLAIGHTLTYIEQGELILRVDKDREILKACIQGSPPKEQESSHGVSVEDFVKKKALNPKSSPKKKLEKHSQAKS